MSEIKPHNSTTRLGTAPLWKLIISLSIPGMLGMMAMTVYQLVDTFWVAKLGHEAIAAITIVGPLHFIIISIGLGSGIGISSLASRRFGEGNFETTNHIAGQIFVISAVFGAAAVIVYLVFSEPLLRIAGATPDIMDESMRYLVILACGSPFMLFQPLSSQLLRASGDAVRPMVFTIIGAVVNIGLDPLLIFGLGPFPEMGIGGAALATVISQVLAAVAAFVYIVVLRRSAYRIRLHHIKPDLPILRSVYAVGLPTMIITISESFSFIILNHVLGGFGSMVLAGGGLAMRVVDFVFMPVFGASQGVLPIIGYNFGAKIFSRLWRTVRLTSLGLIGVLAIISVISFIWSSRVIGIFTDDPELISVGVVAIRFFISMVILFGPAQVFITLFTGLGKGRDVFILSMTRQVLLIITLFTLPNLFGINGAWVSLPISDAVGFFIGGVWVLREYRKQRKKYGANWS